MTTNMRTARTAGMEFPVRAPYTAADRLPVISAAKKDPVSRRVSRYTAMPANRT